MQSLIFHVEDADIINLNFFLFNLESESSTNRHPMTEHLAITDEAFYDAKKRCGGDHVMLT